MKYIGNDFARKDWVSSESPAERKETYKKAILISLVGILILIIIH